MQGRFWRGSTASSASDDLSPPRRFCMCTGHPHSRTPKQNSCLSRGTEARLGSTWFTSQQVPAKCVVCHAEACACVCVLHPARKTLSISALPPLPPRLYPWHVPFAACHEQHAGDEPGQHERNVAETQVASSVDPTCAQDHERTREHTPSPSVDRGCRVKRHS